MHHRVRIPVASYLVLTSLVTTTGCNDEAIRIAREASDRQAAQNQQMAELQHEVARGTHELVKSDAEARKKFAVVHRDLQHERKQLGSSWNALESERQRVDHERRSDSIWQALLTLALGSLVVAAFFAYLRQVLASAQCDDSVDAEVAGLLVNQLLLDTPGNIESSQPAVAGEFGLPTAISATQIPDPPT